MSEETPPKTKLRMAETPAEQREWMAQWRLAEEGLLEVKRQELRAMTDEEVLETCDLLLADADRFYIAPHYQSSSGLVEQQRIFQRARVQP